MRIWLIYDENDVKKNEWYINEYQRLAQEKGISLTLILTHELTLLIDKKPAVLYKGKKVKLPDIAIVRTIDYKLSYHLHLCHIRVANPCEVSRICNDKALTYELIAGLAIPMIPTVLCKREQLYQQLLSVSYPAVVKTVDGHGGQEVFLLSAYKEDEIEGILEKTSSDFVIQPLYGSRHEDLRVYVLGNQIIAAVLRRAKGEFKANFSLGGEACQYHLSETEKCLVRKIIKALPSDFIGIDFLIDDDGTLVFNEIEDVVGSRMLYQTSKLNIAEEYLNYLLKGKQLC